VTQRDDNNWEWPADDFSQEFDTPGTVDFADIDGAWRTEEPPQFTMPTFEDTWGRSSVSSDDAAARRWDDSSVAAGAGMAAGAAAGSGAGRTSSWVSEDTWNEPELFKHPDMIFCCHCYIYPRRIYP
jgi:hypothetical protein